MKTYKHKQTWRIVDFKEDYNLWNIRELNTTIHIDFMVWDWEEIKQEGDWIEKAYINYFNGDKRLKKFFRESIEKYMPKVSEDELLNIWANSGDYYKDVIKLLKDKWLLSDK